MKLIFLPIQPSEVLGYSELLVIHFNKGDTRLIVYQVKWSYKTSN